MFALNTTGSHCASEVRVNPFTGTAKVTFRTGHGPYTFRKVSRRQLAKAVLLEAVGGVPSVGSFINTRFWA
jgi:hypothetical protein